MNRDKKWATYERLPSWVVDAAVEEAMKDEEREHGLVLAAEIALVACTGLRLSELVALRWGDLDGAGLAVKVPSNARIRTRVVPFTVEVASRLSEVRAHSGASECDFAFAPTQSRELYRRRLPSSLQNVARRMRRRFEAKSRSYPGEPHLFRWQQLRHFAVSSWVEEGLPLQELIRRVGYSQTRFWSL